MINVSHLSGHSLEDIQDKSLIATDVGDDSIKLRLVHDIADKWRLGGSLIYILGTVNSMKKLGAEQFLDWMPQGESELQATPFISFGLEENGVDKYILSKNIQLGYYWGKHMNASQERLDDIIRISLGYYSGLDPRQKYSHYKKSMSSFGYLGINYEY
jgi:hypothetical protein